MTLTFRLHLATDMKDREMVFWTTRPNFLFVATGLNEPTYILGTISMQKKSEDTAELNRLSVRPEVRGQGLGKLLVNAFIEDASKSGFGWIYLETTDPQQIATSLYEKIGFNKIGEGGISHVIGPDIPECIHGVYVIKYLYKI